MATEDFSTWIPKGQAAADLGISERSLERLIAQHKLRRGYMRVPGRKPLAVLHPGDVAALKGETIAAAPMSTPAEAPHENRTELAIRPTSQAALSFLSALMAAVPPPPHALFLTIKEAAVYTGLPQTYLKRLIHEGKLAAINAGGYRIRRTDLEKL